MILIGLTGSLATGKSTVSALLSAPLYSLPIIDADRLARAVVAPGTYGYRKVLQHFGPTTPDLLLPVSDDAEGNDRPIDRAALGRRVFGQEPERVRDRKALNAIIHPLVRLAMARDILYYYLCGHWAVVLDIPLLYESGLDIFVSIVIMVAVKSPAVQLQRLRQRDTHLSEREARERVGCQMGVEEKVGRTLIRGGGRGKVLWNDEGREELEGEVERIMGEVEREAGGWMWRVWVRGSPLGALGVGVVEMVTAWWARQGWERGRRG